MEVEGVSLEILCCGVGSFEKLEREVLFGNLFLSFQDYL